MVQLRTLIVSFIVVTACGLQADEFAVTGPVTVVRVCRGDSAIFCATSDELPGKPRQPSRI